MVLALVGDGAERQSIAPQNAKQAGPRSCLFAKSLIGSLGQTSAQGAHGQKPGTQQHQRCSTVRNVPVERDVR
jgi:hypothetical protein